MGEKKKEHIEVRTGIDADKYLMKEWLFDDEVLEWFPMINLVEVEDAVRICMSYQKIGGIFTAEIDGIPLGIANLYINGFSKIRHQALFAIIVRRDARGRGIGTALLTHLIDRARDQFSLEMLHLEVYAGNPAIRLYERFGFEVYGKHPAFLKKDGVYSDKILMQKVLK